MESPLENLGIIIYAVRPNKTTFEFENEVPNYADAVLPYIFTYIIVDTLVNLWKRRTFCLVDGITSMSAGLINDCIRVVTLGVEFMGYKWMYEYRLFDWQWNSIWTWWMAFVLADLGYYIAHRAGHEIAIFWAGHASHHDSEFFNGFVGLRQASFRRFFSIGIYLPGAILGVPYTAMLVHVQLNIIYQFWLHTENIPSLGPIEWIFNTPILHKIHHGRNKWCLDKNYGGVLILFDRLFGTYQGPIEGEEIFFGVLDQPQSFDALYLQVFYFKMYLERAWAMTTSGDKIKALFYGPAWYPGTPRLGDTNAIPDKTEARPIYNPPISLWMKLYGCVHYIMLVILHHKFVNLFVVSKWYIGWSFFFVLIGSFSLIGQLFDGHPWAPTIEALRSGFIAMNLLFIPATQLSIVNTTMIYLYVISLCYWITYLYKENNASQKEKLV